MDSKNQSISDDFDQDYGHFDTDEMDDIAIWEYGENYMITYILLKIVFTILSLTCNVPAGIFTPVFTIGAVFGQLYCSYLLRIMFALGYHDTIKYRGMYSIIGAAALTATVTRTLSVAVMTLELLGHLSHVVPIISSVLTAYIISEMIYPESFYEAMFKLRGLEDLLKKKGQILIRNVLEFEDRFTDFNFLHTEMDMA